MERQFFQAKGFAGIQRGETGGNQVECSETMTLSHAQTNEAWSIEVSTSQMFTAGDFQPDQSFQVQSSGSSNITISHESTSSSGTAGQWGLPLPTPPWT